MLIDVGRVCDIDETHRGFILQTKEAKSCRRNHLLSTTGSSNLMVVRPSFRFAAVSLYYSTKFGPRSNINMIFSLRGWIVGIKQAFRKVSNRPQSSNILESGLPSKIAWVSSSLGRILLPPIPQSATFPSLSNHESPYCNIRMLTGVLLVTR